MRRYTTWIFVVLLLSSVFGFGQGLVRFDMLTMEKIDNQMHYVYEVQIAPHAIASSQALRISPKFKSGNHFYNLPSITLIGSNKNQVIRRWRHNHRLEKDTVFTFVDQKKDTVVHFNGYFPYQPWMKHGEVVVAHDIMGYRGRRSLTSIALRTPVHRRDSVENQFFFDPQKKKNSTSKLQSLGCELDRALVSRPKTVSREQRELLMHVSYPRDCYTIEIGYQNNAEEKKKLDEFIQELTKEGLNKKEMTKSDLATNAELNNGNIKVEKIFIKAYASPEGAFSHNEQLADKRAKELMQYIIDKTHLPPELFSCESIAEDWEGLMNIILKAEIPDKEKVLEIIRTTGILEGREGKLMRLKQGAPYKYILKNIFPKLSRVICKITYSIEK